jgi:hypothetical protein
MPDAAIGGSMDDVKISPLAKRLAEENSIDWRQIHGTGPEGRVIERDILTYLAKVMSGEAELPHQPDVSEPPPPAGAMPDFGQIHSLAGASASLAREGVDLSSMLADPVFGSVPASGIDDTSHVQAGLNLEPIDADLDDAIFDLDLDDGIVEEPAVTGMPGMTDAITLGTDAVSPMTVMPKPSDSADVVLDMDDHLADLPSNLTPGSGVPAEQNLSLDAFEPAPSSVSEFSTSSAPDFALSSDQNFDFHLDDEPVVQETHLPDTHFGSAPAMDFGLETPSESEPSSFGDSLTLEPEHSTPVFSTPEPVMPEPVMPEPVMPEPVMPEPVMHEPIVHEPVLPSFSAPLEMGLAAAAGLGAAHLAAGHEPHVEPTTQISSASGTTDATSSAVARDFFSVATLRRSFNTKPLQETAAQLAQALDAHDVPLTPFLARAAGRGHFGSSLALGSLDGEALKTVAMPHLEGAFRDLIHAIQSAHLTSASADLTVLDASGLGADDVVLPVGGALLALGRANDAQATLTLSGKFDIASGGAFLERVAGMLENPVGLLV